MGWVGKLGGIRLGVMVGVSVVPAAVEVAGGMSYF